MRFNKLKWRLIAFALTVAFLFSGAATYAQEAAPEPAVQETPRPEETQPPEETPEQPPAVDQEKPESVDQDKPPGRTCYAIKKLKLYKSRKTGSKVLKSVPKNEALYEISVRGEWSKVKYKKKTGYVKTKLLTAKAPTPVEQTIDVDILIDLDNGGNTGLEDLDKSRKKARDWSGKIVYGEGGMSIPQLFQFDFPQIVCTYNGKPRSARTSGCSMASLSMIVAYLKGNLEQNPHTLFREACQLGLYHGNGLSHEDILTMGKRYGIVGEWRSMDGAALQATLKAGTPVIAHMGEGVFTEGGHYIVLRGVTEDGKILVNDPASAERTKMAYPVGLFMAECKTSTPFMLCAIAEETDENARDGEKTELNGLEIKTGLVK